MRKALLEKQKWMPRTIHALTYKLTDICEKKLTNSTDANDDQIILNLFKCKRTIKIILKI